MKILYLYILAPLLVINVVQLQGQHSETISVVLSDPDDEGTLLLYNHNGTITVEGQNRSDVEVVIKSKKESRKKASKRAGLKIIPKSAMGVSILEEDNEIHISTSNNDMRDFLIRVPLNFSLQLSTHHNGRIYVSNVVGEHEIESHHGDIELQEVGGSVIADTHHGEIEVSMTRVYTDAPMAFTTYHGDVDVSFPTSTNAILKLKSGKGDIYTDFDLEIVDQDIEKSSKNGIKKIKLGGWTKGKIGSGGPELLMDTYHGDVIIRKTKN